jgi:hypothetical protein
MKISSQSSAGWRLREAPFPFQTTYVTPLKELPDFVSTILARFTVADGAVWIEQIVFEPRELIWYLRGRGFVSDEGKLNRAILHAESRAEVAELLECVLGQWTDFAFIPSPKEFAIYADHDEYTTIFVSTAEVLNRLNTEMENKGFKTAKDWTWTGPHSPGVIEEAKTNV